MKMAYIFLTGLLFFLAPLSAQGLPPFTDLEPIEHAELPPVAAASDDRQEQQAVLSVAAGSLPPEGNAGTLAAADTVNESAPDGSAEEAPAIASAVDESESEEAIATTDEAETPPVPNETEAAPVLAEAGGTNESETHPELVSDSDEAGEADAAELADAPEPEEPEAEIPQKPEYRELEIAGADHELTVKYRELYMAPRYQKIIIQALERSVPYRPYIREKLKENGLPLLLQYLPIVESHYTVGAVSYAGATGIWQFMTNSMAPLLSRNTWYDERRDPWKSTDAAILKLSANYTQFKDWAVAIAAYNCGAGAMARVLRQNQGKDFWYLAEHELLKSQSVQYVPKLLAIADLIENAEYYGLTELAEADRLIEEVEPEQFAYLSTTGMYSFRQIAELSGIEEAVLRLLNPALLRGCTPARIEYRLRLPAGSEPEELLQKLKASGTPSDAIVYTVSKGDTLWGISRKYKLTVADLCLVNDIKENNILRINQKLIIPVFD